MQLHLEDHEAHLLREVLRSYLRELRGEIVDTPAMAEALRSGRLRGYATDVLDEEPPRADHPLTRLPNCLVTPHVGSRTHESVQRQAMAAVTNLLAALRGGSVLAQVKPEVPLRRIV